MTTRDIIGRITVARIEETWARIAAERPSHRDHTKSFYVRDTLAPGCAVGVILDSWGMTPAACGFVEGYQDRDAINSAVSAIDMLDLDVEPEAAVLLATLQMANDAGLDWDSLMRTARARMTAWREHGLGGICSCGCGGNSTGRFAKLALEWLKPAPVEATAPKAPAAPVETKAPSLGWATVSLTLDTQAEAAFAAEVTAWLSKVEHALAPA